MEENIINLIDENGVESQFEIILTLEAEGKEYAILMPLDDEEAEEALIFRIDDLWKISLQYVNYYLSLN